MHLLSGDNSLVPFRLRCTKGVLKSEKVYKYFVQDCNIMLLFLMTIAFGINLQLLITFAAVRRAKCFLTVAEIIGLTR